MGIHAKVTVLEEGGHRSAMLGLSFNKKQPIEKMPLVASKLAHQDGGHNKFLESIAVWLDVELPRYVWQEFDTYRVGMTKQSESTMHTLTRDDLTLESAFEEGTNPEQIQYVRDLIAEHNRLEAWLKEQSSPGRCIDDRIPSHARLQEGIKETRERVAELFIKIKQNLPEGFIQRRQIKTNYKTLRTIVGQRRKHRLPHWQVICRALEELLEYPEYIFKSYQEN